MKPKDQKNKPINLKFYNWYFSAIRDQIFSDLADGTSKLTISKNSLQNYYIEYFPIEEQNKFVDKYILAYDKLKAEVQKSEQILVSKINELI